MADYELEKVVKNRVNTIETCICYVIHFVLLQFMVAMVQ